MKKTNEPGKELVKDLHEMNNKPIKDKISEIVIFVKRLTATLFALAIGGLGTVAVLYARTNLHDLNQIAVIVSGACAIVDAGYLLYVALMKVGK